MHGSISTLPELSSHGPIFLSNKEDSDHNISFLVLAVNCAIHLNWLGMTATCIWLQTPETHIKNLQQIVKSILIVQFYTPQLFYSIYSYGNNDVCMILSEILNFNLQANLHQNHELCFKIVRFEVYNYYHNNHHLQFKIPISNTMLIYFTISKDILVENKLQFQ